MLSLLSRARHAATTQSSRHTRCIKNNRMLKEINERIFINQLLQCIWYEVIILYIFCNNYYFIFVFSSKWPWRHWNALFCWYSLAWRPVYSSPMHKHVRLAHCILKLQINNSLFLWHECNKCGSVSPINAAILCNQTSSRPPQYVKHLYSNVQRTHCMVTKVSRILTLDFVMWIRLFCRVHYKCYCRHELESLYRVAWWPWFEFCIKNNFSK